MKESFRSGLSNIASEIALHARLSGHIIKESLLHPNTTTIIEFDRASKEIKVT